MSYCSETGIQKFTRLNVNSDQEKLAKCSVIIYK